MTAQVMERLFYIGEWHNLATTPLEAYFDQSGKPRPRMGGTCTSLHREYIGSWQVHDGRLYLVGLKLGWSAVFDKGTDKDGLGVVFPDKDEVFAEWFTGTLRCPQGKRVVYVHGGFGSTWEKDLLIEVKDGVVQSVQVKKGKPGTPWRDLGRMESGDSGKKSGSGSGQKTRSIWNLVNFLGSPFR